VASPVPQSAAGATGNDATPTITEPSGSVSGDLLYAVVGSADAGTAITGLTGWNELAEGDDGQGNRYWHGWIERGASAPDLVAAAANARWHTSCVRIDGHDPTTPIGTDHGTSTGSGTTPDPPNVDPGSSRDHLSLASVIQEGKGATRFTPPTTPGAYTEQTDAGTSGGGAGTGHIGGTIAARAYTGQAENPGTFTSSTNDGWIAFTVLVRPAAGPISVSVGTALSTSSAGTVNRDKVYAPGTVLSTSSAGVATPKLVKAVAVGTALSTSSAGAVNRDKVYAPGTVLSTSTAGVVTPVQAQKVAVGTALSTSSAGTVGRQHSYTVGTGLSTSSAGTAASTKVYSITVAASTASAGPAASTKSYTVGTGLSTSTAGLVTLPGLTWGRMEAPPHFSTRQEARSSGIGSRLEGNSS
jgi:hypothetical protein